MHLVLIRNDLLELRKGIDLSVTRGNTSGNYTVSNWDNVSDTLAQMYQISFLKNDVRAVYKLGENYRLKVGELVVPANIYPKFKDLIERLNDKCTAVIDVLSEFDDYQKDDLLIKLPPMEKLIDFENVIHDFNQALTQCPLFDSTIEFKFKRLEMGTNWIILIPAMLSLIPLAKFFQMCIESTKTIMEIRNIHLDNVLKKMEIDEKVKQQIAEESKKYEIEMLRDNLVEKGKSINPDKVLDGEDVERLVTSVKKICFLFDKGLEVYPSDNADEEVKNAFPFKNSIAPNGVQSMPIPPKQLSGNNES